MFGLHKKTRSEGAATPTPLPDSAPDYSLRGFTTGTSIATEQGWRMAGAIARGDRVVTFDNGLQPVVAVTRRTHLVSDDSLPCFACPIRIPADAIGNDETLLLLPEMAVMLESDVLEDMTGSPFALVPAKALVGYRGVERLREQRPVEIVSLRLAQDELIFADGNTLMLAPATVPGIVPLDLLDDVVKPVTYPVTRGEQARALVAAMAEEDARAFGAAAYGAAA